jgi:hypothetical protein
MHGTINIKWSIWTSELPAGAKKPNTFINISAVTLIVPTFFFFSFLIWHFLSIYYRCRELLLHSIVFTGTHTTLGRTPLDKRSARRRDLCLITQNTNKRETSMPLLRFESAIPASERPQTDVLEGATSYRHPRGVSRGSIGVYRQFRCSWARKQTAFILLAPELFF